MECGWTSARAGHAESHNTDLMLTFEGQLWMARFAQKYLKLKEVKPEWLTETARVVSKSRPIQPTN